MKGTTNSMGLAAGTVTRAKLAQDALYSPAVGINGNLTLTPEHIGKTIVATLSNSTVTVNAGNFPIGAEFAVVRYTFGTELVCLEAAGGARLYVAGYPSAASKVKIPVAMGMIVAKQVIQANTWVVYGDVEVMT